MTKKQMIVAVFLFGMLSGILIVVPSQYHQGTIQKPPLLSLMNEKNGRCVPDGSTGEFLVGKDGWVKCAVRPDGVPIFIAKSKEEALGRRLNYLNHLAETEKFFSKQFGSVEKAKRAIKFCGDNLYFSLHGGCDNVQLLPYPGMFPFWVSRDSSLGEKIQADFELRFGKSNI